MADALLLMRPDGTREVNWSAWERLLPQVGPTALALAQLVAHRCRPLRGQMSWRVTEVELADELGLGRDAARSLLPVLVEAGLLSRPSRGLLLATALLLSPREEVPPAAGQVVDWSLAGEVAPVIELRPAVGAPPNVGIPDIGGRGPSPAAARAAFNVGNSNPGAVKFRHRVAMHADAGYSKHEHARTAPALDAGQVLVRLHATGFNDRRLDGAVLAEPERALACLEYAQGKARSPGGVPGLWRRVFTAGEHPSPAKPHLESADRDRHLPAEEQPAGPAGLSLALADLGDADPAARAALLADARSADLSWLAGQLRVHGVLT